MVTVAKEMSLSDPEEDLGVQVVKSSASQADDKAGDGTSTTTILARAIAREGHKDVTAGRNPMDTYAYLYYFCNNQLANNMSIYLSVMLIFFAAVLYLYSLVNYSLGSQEYLSAILEFSIGSNWQ